MDFLSVHQTPEVKLDTLLIAFSGWADAAEGASSAIKFVERKLTSTKFAEIDPEEFYDFSQTRPQTTRTRDGKRRIHWPKNDFSYIVNPESNRGIMVFMGVEPNLRWRTYSNAIAQLAQDQGVETVVLVMTVLAACLWSAICGFPFNWAVMFAVAISSVVHLSAAWVPKDDRPALMEVSHG